MAHLPKSPTIEDAHACLQQAKPMVERARSMWLKAQVSLDEAQRMRETLHSQIEALARHGPFRPQFTSALLSGILDAIIEGTGADKGNIQLFNHKTGELLILVHRGFDEPFLEFFDVVHEGEGACGTALKRKRRVIVPDVANSPLFSGSRILEVMLDAGIRSVQSTPLIGESGRIWGMLSTHYRDVNHPGTKDLQLIDYFAAWAADILEAEHHAAHRGPVSPTDSNGFLAIAANPSSENGED